MATVLSALILSDCSRSLFVDERSCRAHNVQTVSCDNTQQAVETLGRRAFEFLIIDFDLAGAVDVLSLYPKDIQGCPTTILGLKGGPESSTQTYSNQVAYWLEKPLSGDLVGKTLRTAYGVVLSQKRISFRHAVRIKALATFQHPACNRKSV